MWDPEQYICVLAHHTAGCGPGGHIKANIILQGERKKPQRELDCCLTKRKTTAALLEVCARMTSGHFQRHSLFKCFPPSPAPKITEVLKGRLNPRWHWHLLLLTNCSHSSKLQLWVLQWLQSGAAHLGSTSVTLVTGHKPHHCHICFPHRLQILTRTNNASYDPSPANPNFVHSPGKASRVGSCVPGGAELQEQLESLAWPAAAQVQWHRGPSSQSSDIKQSWTTAQEQTWTWELMLLNWENSRPAFEPSFPQELDSPERRSWESCCQGFCWGMRRNPSRKVYEVILTSRIIPCRYKTMSTALRAVFLACPRKRWIVDLQLKEVDISPCSLHR